MKFTKYAIAIVFTGLAIWFLVATLMAVNHRGHEFDLTGPGDNETYAHKVARYRAGADAALPSAITNAVVGLRLILNQHTDTTDNNFQNWTAESTVEFINNSGGVERKTFKFTFGAGGGSPNWWPAP
jgi:hypothetical protein